MAFICSGVRDSRSFLPDPGKIALLWELASLPAKKWRHWSWVRVMGVYCLFEEPLSWHTLQFARYSAFPSSARHPATEARAKIVMKAIRKIGMHLSPCRGIDLVADVRTTALPLP